MSINYLACYLADYEKYKQSIVLLKQIQHEKNKEFVIKSARELLGLLDAAEKKLSSDQRFLSLIRDPVEMTKDILNCKNSAKEILTQLIENGVEFDHDKTDQFEYFDFWREYFLKHRCQFLFNDWFMTFSETYLSKGFVDSLMYNGDFLLNSNLSKYKNLVHYSYDELIFDRYVFLKEVSNCDLVLENNYDHFTKDYCDDSNVILLWSV